MSASRGGSGETSWSDCSRRGLQRQLASNSLKCLAEEDQKRSENFDGRPGVTIGPDEQCRLFLKAKKAKALDNGDSRCQGLQCKYRPTDASVFLAGPALEGASAGKF
jgi:hypothetical protein